jgi:hypothetical protein
MLRVCSMLVLVACSKPATTTSTSGSGSSGGSATAATTPVADAPTATPAVDPCSAQGIGLGSARELIAWTPPAGCSVAGDTANKVVYPARPACTATPPAVASGPILVATTRSFSPAQVGLRAFDDGKTITFVSVQRSNCPNDPRPMPGPNQTFVFTVPTEGARKFDDRSCTMPRACP